MKVTLTPAVKEEVLYYSDIKGEVFYLNIPHAVIKIEGNYGSGFDGLSTELHLTNEESKEILSYIKSKLTSETLKRNSEFWNCF